MIAAPLVLVSNMVKIAESLNRPYPGRVGMLYGVGEVRPPRGMPYALDNGKFPVWSSGKEWDPDKYVSHLAKASKCSYPPMWAVVPDEVMDPDRTMSLWGEWSPRVASYGFPLAVAVQDGMVPRDVRNLSPPPAVVFVGGSTEWKWRSLRAWTKEFPRVHVGRVNTENLLWSCHLSGAESSDGTGWWHLKQLRQLRRYLAASGEGRTKPGLISWGKLGKGLGVK